MEGLGDAIHLAQLAGDSDRLKLYTEHAKMGYRWLLLLPAEQPRRVKRWAMLVRL